MTSKRLRNHRSNAARQQHGHCWYCGVLMQESGPLGCTAEHLLPVSDSGPEAKGNIVAACWFCNEHRHRRPQPMTPEDYLRHVQKRVSKGRWNVPLR